MDIFIIPKQMVTPLDITSRLPNVLKQSQIKTLLNDCVHFEVF
jgi:hypothetical protein